MFKQIGRWGILIFVVLHIGCVPYYEQAGYDERRPPETESRVSETYGEGYETEGLASFMADEMHGKRTASGKIFNLREMTAAHPTLPFGTIVEVTNLKNNQKVQVEIIDRGPFVKGRVIDVSFQAAKELGFVESGTAKVRLKIIRMGSKK